MEKQVRYVVSGPLEAVKVGNIRLNMRPAGTYDDQLSFVELTDVPSEDDEEGALSILIQVDQARAVADVLYVMADVIDDLARPMSPGADELEVPVPT